MASRFDANALLAVVEPAVRLQFSTHLQTYELRRGDVLHDQGEDLEWVYFPTKGLVAIFSETVDGESVGCAMVGYDGAIGVFEACGSQQSFAKAAVQIEGEAIRLRASTYRELFDQSRALRTAVHKYVEALLMEARQFVTCNALHSVEGRLSRSILDAVEYSRVEQVLSLTQDALAQMLGAQRTTVAAAVSKLQRAGLIRSGRGAIEVLDPTSLERVACVCRRTIQYAQREIQSSDTESCEALASA
jgi:CRP-like cAMP-binding protein